MGVKLMKITMDDGEEYTVWPTESYPELYSDMRHENTGGVYTGDALMERVVTPACKLLNNLVSNYADDYSEPKAYHADPPPN